MADAISQKSIKKNYLYNLLYQIFLILIPIITTPYLSRVLGSDGIGQNSFSLSINTYFTMFANLGFVFYAQREIAMCLGNKEEQSKAFWEIVIIRAITTFLSLIVYYLLIVLNFFPDYKTLLYIYGINIVYIAIDPSFIFQGNEDFKQIALRNVIVKSLSITFIFIFVRQSTDLWIYALISAMSYILSAALMFPFLKTYIVKVEIKKLRPFRHFLPSLRLFIPVLASSLYQVMDKTMLGYLVTGTTTFIENGTEVIKKNSDIENGYYQQANKIILMLLTITSSLGTVMISRNSEYVKANRIDLLKENIYKASRFTFFLSFPMMFGVIAVARNFSPWFFGDGYEKVPYLMMIFSWLFIAIGMSYISGMEYLIPLGRYREFTISTLVGALINFILNYYFIKMWASYGAALASIISETAVTFTQFLFVRKEFDWKKYFGPSWRYPISGAIMFSIIYPISLFLQSTIYWTFLLVFIGGVVYFLILFILKDDFLLNFVHKFLLKIKNKKQN
jgi:O-antigen/teichoic acid export membrane protein